MSTEAYSEYISAFLNFMRDSVQQNHMAETQYEETNAATQDILHSMELESHKYHEMAALAKKLAEVRRDRRIAKDTICVTNPIVEWVEGNPQIIKALERLLGDVRKGERYVQNRIYIPRTNILEKKDE